MSKKIRVESQEDQDIKQSQNISEEQNRQSLKQEQQTDSPEQDNGDGQDPCADIRKKAEEFEAKLKELSDKYLRLAAEYDNYRKRTMREKADLIKTAGENILVDLLPVVDDFERALEHIDSATDIEALKEGIHLIYKRFRDFLKQKGVEEIPAVGQPLDTDLHEAVQQVPAQSEDQKGKIVHVVQKGYKLNDKVIRHAKVVVAM